MLKYITLIICLFGVLNAQKLPYGEPKYFEIGTNEELQQITLSIPSTISQNIIENIQPVQYQSRDYYYLKIRLDKNQPAHFKLIKSHFTDEMIVYFIDLDIKGWVGPYSIQILKNNPNPISGGLNTQDILIEISVPADSDVMFPVQEIIGPEKRPENFNDLMAPTGKSGVLPAQYRVGTKKLNSFSSTVSPIQRDHLKNILLCGYWPPSNECIRPFSTALNHDGWIGDNWEERGYDIHAYFPEFSDPDCENCGQGDGDLEVDYQDTSEDWWNIVDSINPVAIITFSRGGMDYRWEIEWMCTNWEESQWIADFEEPLYPTPSPPDSTYPQNTPRYSSLPMDSIYSAVSLSGLNTYPVIDYTYGTGNYLSEFLGYHGLWYKAEMDSLNIISSSCHVAGHIHIGGYVDWDDAHEAVKLTLREVIEVLDENEVIIGDVNYDGLISMVDLYFIVSFLMGEIEFDDNELIIADVNFDLSVDIYDVLMISNILLES